MAGHSKWANIQHRKKRQDAKRGKLFTKLIRAITVAARVGGADLDANPRLRDAIDKAKVANMTNDNIDRAIKRGVGNLDDANVEEILYEGYGPGGVAVMIECLTDNRNRTVAAIRHALTKCGGSLGTAGSVAYLFTKQGRINFAKGADEDKVMAAALEAGADDVLINNDGSIDIVTTPELLSQVRQTIQAKRLTPAYAELTMIASNEVDLDKDKAEKMLKLQDALEDIDDVQEVYSNADISEQILVELEGK